MILLINPNNRILSPYAGIEPPLWAGLIASDLISKGHKVRILDAEVLNLSTEETAIGVEMLNPEKVIIVVMGNNPSVSSTPKMPVTKRLVELLEGRDIAVTGLHPSALPYRTRSELGVEVLEGKIFEGTPDIPFEFMPMDMYIAHNWHCLDGSPRQPYGVTYTSLGCPYSCSFCNIHALYGASHKVWYRNIEAVLKEIDLLVQDYGVRNIKIWDELFTLKSKRVQELCNGLIERRYGLNIWAYARADSNLTAALLRDMKQAGFNWLGVGFESAYDSVLAKVKKKTNHKIALKAVDMIHNAGIHIHGNFIFGLPSDTLESMRETLEFAKSLNIEYTNFYQFRAYPGSSLHNVYSNKDWESYSQFSKYRAIRITDFQNLAFQDFYRSHKYRGNIKNKFGQRAIDEIDDILARGKPVTAGA